MTDLDELYDLVDEKDRRVRQRWIAPAAVGVTAMAVAALMPQALWASKIGQVAEPGSHLPWVLLPAVLTGLVLAVAGVRGESGMWAPVLAVSGAGTAALLAMQGLSKQGEPGPGPWLALAGAGAVVASALCAFVLESRRRGL